MRVGCGRDSRDGEARCGRIRAQRRKQWCSTGSYAGVIMGMFRTGGPGARGVSAFLVEANLPGITVERVTEKLGIHTSNTCDLAFDGVEVGEEALLARRAPASEMP